MFLVPNDFGTKWFWYQMFLVPNYLVPSDFGTEWFWYQMVLPFISDINVFENGNSLRTLVYYFRYKQFWKWLALLGSLLNFSDFKTYVLVPNDFGTKCFWYQIIWYQVILVPNVFGTKSFWYQLISVPNIFWYHMILLQNDFGANWFCQLFQRSKSLKMVNSLRTLAYYFRYKQFWKWLALLGPFT